MVAWSEIEADAPELAARVRERFQARKHKTMETLRADGSPRISGIETQIGEQVTFGMPGSHKFPLNHPQMRQKSQRRGVRE
jgi:hypothetical protein